MLELLKKNNITHIMASFERITTIGEYLSSLNDSQIDELLQLVEREQRARLREKYNLSKAFKACTCNGFRRIQCRHCKVMFDADIINPKCSWHKQMLYKAVPCTQCKQI